MLVPSQGGVATTKENEYAKVALPIQYLKHYKVVANDYGNDSFAAIVAIHPNWPSYFTAALYFPPHNAFRAGSVFWVAIGI
ncbi:hypothetical protein JP36_11310 [Gallibacterium genomosp. 1]|uniref:Uncharacterized protein n=1 Tax=Gallibacterium genomosp. 1 TaxID=155515 RepID=A0A0A2XVE5_9PAST|nr:hypothetical protein JP36_11310 [Gallibacterium genomosp. 1]